MLYVDALLGSNHDMVETVSFDMRDDFFTGMGFTCHCPIWIQASMPSSAPCPEETTAA
jgi:hypothetical protein